MEDQKWYTDELHAQGKKPSWDNFSLARKAQNVSSTSPTDELIGADQPVKKATPPSSVQLQAQSILETRDETRKNELWPVYGVFIFAFAMLGYTLYHLSRFM